MSAFAGKGTRARPLAHYVLRELDPLVAKQGFGEASLLMQWREIVGARVAAICQPERLKWPPRPRGKTADGGKTPGKPGKAARDDRPQEPATLILRVEPGFGLEIQHMAQAIIDRVNAHLGWRCVSRLTLRQEPIAGAKLKAARDRPTPPRDPAMRAHAEAAAAGIKDDALRETLARLGEHALAQSAKNMA